MIIKNSIKRIGKLGLCSAVSVVLIICLAILFFMFTTTLHGLEGYVAFWAGLLLAIHLVAIISLTGLILGLISFIKRKSWFVFLSSLINLLFFVPCSGYLFMNYSQQLSNPYRIHAAVQTRDIKKVQKLLDKGFDINYTGGTITPLARAATNNDIEMVKFLISRGARVDDVGCAVGFGSIEMVQYLFDHGAKVAGLDTAIGRRDISIIKLLLEHGANVNEVVPNSNGRTFLHNSINTTPEIVELLISRGADVNALEDDHRTPLHCLAELYYPQDWQSADHIKRIADALLDAGADIEAETYEGKTPLALAAEHAGMFRPNGAITVLSERGAKLSNIKDERCGLIAASYIMSPEELAVWFKGNITNINAFNRYHSPMICSVTRGAAPSAVELLIRANANLNTVDGEDRNTSLHWAVLYGRYEAANLLIKGGADINMQNRWGYTPLHMSPFPTMGEEARGVEYDTKMLELLLQNGARVDITDTYGKTVLDKYTHLLPQSDKGRQYQRTVIELLMKYNAVSGKH